MLTGITHHRTDKIFATCGERVDIWEENRSEPLRSLQWGVDSLHSVKFNPIEVIGSVNLKNLLCKCFSKVILTHVLCRRLMSWQAQPVIEV